VLELKMCFRIFPCTCQCTFSNIKI